MPWPALIDTHGVECVLIAIPSAKGSEIERIVDKCRECKVSFTILPPISELFNRQASVTQARKLAALKTCSAAKWFVPTSTGFAPASKTGLLLVTGAGGSIGSELVRQVASFNPRKADPAGALGERPVQDRPGTFRAGSRPRLRAGGRRRSRRQTAQGRVRAAPAELGLPRRGLQTRAHDGEQLLPGRHQQHLRHLQRGPGGQAVSAPKTSS